jgi:hypothetical protein
MKNVMTHIEGIGIQHCHQEASDIDPSAKETKRIDDEKANEPAETTAGKTMKTSRMAA